MSPAITEAVARALWERTSLRPWPPTEWPYSSPEEVAADFREQATVAIRAYERARWADALSMAGASNKAVDW
jgi:hypothetical protein